MKIQQTVHIDAPPEKIWPFLVEPEKILKWCITFVKFEYTSEQDSGTGAHVYVEEKAGGPLMKINFAVTEWIENRKITLKMTSGSGVKNYRIVSILQPEENGSSYTFAEEVEMPMGIIGKFLGVVGRRVAEKHAKQMLSELKILAEA